MRLLEASSLGWEIAPLPPSFIFPSLFVKYGLFNVLEQQLIISLFVLR